MTSLAGFLSLSSSSGPKLPMGSTEPMSKSCASHRPSNNLQQQQQKKKKDKISKKKKDLTRIAL
jgi:hypothetical protein